MPKDPYKKLFAAIAKVPGRWTLRLDPGSGRRVLIRHTRYKEHREVTTPDYCCPMAAPVAAGLRKELSPTEPDNSRIVDNACTELFEDLYGLTYGRVAKVMRAADKTLKTPKMREYDPRLRARLLAACGLEELE